MIKPIEHDKHEQRKHTPAAGIKSMTSNFFGEHSPLQTGGALRDRAYEERPQQREMALAIAQALIDGEHLCVEAPTGIGKTFAYLVPAIHAALDCDEPIVVSTHTISLQEQLIERDLPTLERLLDLDFKFSIAKGRSNYVCRRRLENTANSPHLFLEDAESLPELDTLYRWAEDSQDGSLSSMQREPKRQLWEAVCCEYGNCMGKDCRFMGKCFFFKARQKLEDADVIVANHALFFSDLAIKNNPLFDDAAILPEYAAAVLDEAHHVEDSASNHLGLRVSSYSVRRVLHRIYNPEHNRGLLADMPFAEARTTTMRLLDQSESFFNRLRTWMDKQDEHVVRYQTPGAIHNVLNDDLARLEAELRDVMETLEEPEQMQEFKSAADMLYEQRLALHSILEMDIDDQVYWIETTGRKNTGVVLNSAPIHVGEMLKKILFDSSVTTIMTSATMAIDGGLEYFKRRTGAVEARELVLSSPFDYRRQVKLYLAENMPDPKDFGSYAPAVAEQVEHFLTMSHGKAFVLFTSYRLMNQVRDLMQEFFLDKKIQLLVQGDGLPRSRMLDVFRDEIDSVIFGTASFWTGVDVPGEALSNVIITRLPFAAPTHPLTAARQEAVEAEGKNSFWHYSLPEAVLKFRQGFGRLVRNKTDQGIVVVLDRRIKKTRYGRIFLDSIPECETVTI